MARRFVSAKNAPLRTAVVGYGYWGPNLVRNVMERPELEFAGLCERDADRAAAFSTRYVGQPLFRDLEMCSPTTTIDALVVATPPRTHHAIVRAALEAGKHVLVEKPLATTSADAHGPDRGRGASRPHADARAHVRVQPAREQGQGADRRRRARRGLLHHLVAHEPGQVPARRRRSATSRRTTCRSCCTGSRSRWSKWRRPAAASSATACTRRRSSPSPSRAARRANIQVSWLAPRKVREMTVVGSHRMVQYDDTASDEAVRVFDRGMEFTDAGDVR